MYKTPPSEDNSTTEVDCRLQIMQLPNEIQERIFDNLSCADILWRIPLVCRLWYDLIQNHFFRRHLVLRRDIPSEEMLTIVNSRRVLHVLRCPALEYASSVIPNALKSCFYLKCLNVGFCSLTENDVAQLACNLPKTLIHLNVEGINTISVNFVSVLVMRCPQLEVLNLSHCRAVCDRCIDLISRHLPHLNRINLDGVLWLSDIALQHLIQGVAVQQGYLTSIWLDGFQLSNHGFHSFFSELVHFRWPLTAKRETALSDMLEEVFRPRFFLTLWVSFCGGLTDDSVEPIASLYGLDSLTLRKAEQVTYGGWNALFSPRPPLKQPALMWLQHLDLSEASNVNDSVVDHICDCCGLHLHTLLLNWCFEVTDHSLNSIVDICVSLRHLSLVGNHTIKGDALSRFSSKEPKRNISVINLTHCNQVYDSILQQLVTDLPEIYIFDYFGERVGGGPDDVCHYDLWRTFEKVRLCID